MRLAGVVFLASTAFGQTYHFSVAAGSGILTVTNRDAARTLVAFHLKGATSSINEIIDIAPGKASQFPLPAGGPFNIDGFLFSDGSIEGPDSWGIAKHLQLYRDVMRGGPAYPSADPDAPDALSYARHWAWLFKHRFGFPPVIVDPDQFRPPPPTINFNTWVASEYQNGLLVAQGTGGRAVCDDALLLSGGAYQSLTCAGIAACLLPNPNGNKAYLSVAATAWGSCAGEVLSSLSELQGTLNTYTNGLASAMVDFGGVEWSLYQTDSCTGQQYNSPPKTGMCMGSGN